MVGGGQGGTASFRDGTASRMRASARDALHVTMWSRNAEGRMPHSVP